MPDNNSLIAKYEALQQHNFRNSDASVDIEEQIKLPGHLWNVSALDFSVNGLYLASGSWDKTILVWDLKTLENPVALDYRSDGGHEQPVTCISWFPLIDNLLMSASADHSLIIWNGESGELLTKLVEHEAWILAMSFASDGLFLASSSWKGDVILWDMTTLQPVIKLNGHNSGIWGCAFNNDSEKILCTASEDTSLRLWDFRVDQKWHSDVMLSGVHNDAIKCCSWSPCGYYVAAGSSDSKISLWDIRMNKAINCLHGHRGEVLDVQFMSLSSALLFSVGDTQCCLWNTFHPQGTSICALQQHAWSYEVECLALSPDSTLIATGSVDQHVSLSTVDINQEYFNSLTDNSVDLPYAQLPVKTTSSSSLPAAEDSKSTAALVDYAKLLSATKEKERGEMVAKQTIRIKAPVTSEVLQDHISHLKTVSGDNKKQSVITLFQDMSLKVPTATSQPFDTSSMRYKSKELLVEKSKLRSLNLPVPKKKEENITAEMLENDGGDGNLVAGKSDDVHENSDNDDDEEYDIEKVTSEMIRITVEAEEDYETEQTSF